MRIREPSHLHHVVDDNDDDVNSPLGGPGSSFTKKLYDIIDTADSTEIVAWARGQLTCSLDPFMHPHARLTFFPRIPWFFYRRLVV